MPDDIGGPGGFARFLEAVGDDAFLSRLDELDDSTREDYLPWLRFLRTDAIANWFCGGDRSDGGPCAIMSPSDREIRRELLARRLLACATSDATADLNRYWRWALADANESTRTVWERCDLRETLAIPGLIAREEAYQQTLCAAIEQLRPSCPPAHSWAIEGINRVVDARTPKPSHAATARVVVTWACDLPAAMRPGLLLTITLGSAAGGGPPFDDSGVFDISFRDSVESIRRQFPAQCFRRMSHDWGFVQQELFTDTSGGFAVLLAQWLTTSGRFCNGYFTLLPWVVVTASVDENAARSGGVAAAVANVALKREVLAEHGVRVLATVDPSLVHPRDDKPADGVQLMPVEGSVADVASQLYATDLLEPIDLEPVRHTLTQGPPAEESVYFGEREKSHHRHFSVADYVPPYYAFKAIEKAINGLGGHGYVHLTASPMTGKSVMVRAIRKRWSGAGRLWPAIGYSIVHGSPESPWLFLHRLVNDAGRLDPDDESGLQTELSQYHPDRIATLPHSVEAVVGILAAVRRRTPASQPVVLVIDGLDELTESGDGVANLRISDMLPAPSELPAGCYVLLVSRPSLRREVDSRLALFAVDEEHYARLNLTEKHAAEYHRLLLDFAEGRLSRYEGNRLAAEVVSKSAGRFLWVRMLCELVDDAIADDVETVKRGLPSADDVLPAYMERICRLPEAPQQSAPPHRQVLLLLAAAYSPVSRELLRRWLGGGVWTNADEHSMNRALDELKTLIDDCYRTSSDSLYQIAHVEVLNWLRTTDAPGWGSAAIVRQHERIVATTPAKITRFPPYPDDHVWWYTLYFLAGHSIASRSYDGAVETLCGTRAAAHEYMQATGDLLGYGGQSLFLASRVSQFRHLISEEPSRLSFEGGDPQLSTAYVDTLMWEAEARLVDDPSAAAELCSTLYASLRPLDVSPEAVLDGGHLNSDNTAWWSWQQRVEVAVCLATASQKLGEYDKALETLSEVEYDIRRFSAKLPKRTSAAERLTNSVGLRRNTAWRLARVYLTRAVVVFLLGRFDSSIRQSRHAIELLSSQSPSERLDDIASVLAAHDLAKCCTNLASCLRTVSQEPSTLLECVRLTNRSLSLLNHVERAWGTLEGVEPNSDAPARKVASLETDLLVTLGEKGAALHLLGKHSAVLEALEPGIDRGVELLNELAVGDSGGLSRARGSWWEIYKAIASLSVTASAAAFEVAKEPGHVYGWESQKIDLSLEHCRRVFDTLFQSRGISAHDIAPDDQTSDELLMQYAGHDDSLASCIGSAYMNAGRCFQHLYQPDTALTLAACGRRYFHCALQIATSRYPHSTRAFDCMAELCICCCTLVGCYRATPSSLFYQRISPLVLDTIGTVRQALSSTDNNSYAARSNAEAAFATLCDMANAAF